MLSGQSKGLIITLTVQEWGNGEIQIFCMFLAGKADGNDSSLFESTIQNRNAVGDSMLIATVWCYKKHLSLHGNTLIVME